MTAYTVKKKRELKRITLLLTWPSERSLEEWLLYAWTIKRFNRPNKSWYKFSSENKHLNKKKYEFSTLRVKMAEKCYFVLKTKSNNSRAPKREARNFTPVSGFLSVWMISNSRSYTNNRSWAVFHTSQAENVRST